MIFIILFVVLGLSFFEWFPMRQVFNPLMLFVCFIIYCVLFGLSVGKVNKWYKISSVSIFFSGISLYFLLFTFAVFFVQFDNVCRGVNVKINAVYQREDKSGTGKECKMSNAFRFFFRCS